MSLRRAITTHGDVLVAGLAGALFLVEILSEARFAEDRGVSIPAALLFSATLAARRRAPLLALLAGAGVIVLSNRSGPPLADTATFLFGFALALYSTGRYTGGPAALAGGLAVVAVLPLAVIEPGQPFSLADSAFIAIFIAGPWFGGRVIRRRQRRERGLEARAVALELERDARAREAVVEERARIARELHDVVGHAISVMLLQARGGRRMLTTDPEETRRALDAIDHAGAQALDEMRRLLGVLRRTEEELALAPRPSLTRIDELVAQLTGTGLPVDLTVEGEPCELPPGIDVSAYRIVQEALTNALKHAGPARARVIVRYTPEELELRPTSRASSRSCTCAIACRPSCSRTSPGSCVPEAEHRDASSVRSCGMRTTIKLDDEVLRAYKKRAAARGTTLAQEVEYALRAGLYSHRETAGHEPFEVLVFDGDGSRALVDIDDNRALQELMDEEDRAG